MIRAGAAVAAGAILCCTGAWAQTETVDGLITVMSRHECRVAPDMVARIFAPEGFSRNFVSDTLARWTLDGTLIEDADGVAKLPVDICPPREQSSTPRDTVLRTFREQGCAADESAILAATPDLSRDQYRAILAPLQADGQLRVDGDLAQLGVETCETGLPEPLLAAFRDNDCSLDEASFQEAVPWMAEAEAREHLRPFFVAGHLTIEGSRATLAPGFCEAD